MIRVCTKAGSESVTGAPLDREVRSLVSVNDGLVGRQRTVRNLITALPAFGVDANCLAFVAIVSLSCEILCIGTATEARKSILSGAMRREGVY